MNQIESYRSWGRIIGQFAFATFLNFFAVASIATTHGAPGAEELWQSRVMAMLLIATFLLVPTIMIFTIAAKLRQEEKWAHRLAAATWIWPLFLLSLSFVLLSLSGPKTT